MSKDYPTLARENSQLRSLVESAYKQGFVDGVFKERGQKKIGIEEAWQASPARETLSQHPQEALQKVVTVREAFALAGHPVPEGWEVYGHTHTTDQLIDPDDPFSLRVHKAIWVLVEPGKQAFMWEDDKWTEGSFGHLVRYYGGKGVYPLSNLPARDCLEALPAVVREALLAKVEGVEA